MIVRAALAGWMLVMWLAGGAWGASVTFRQEVVGAVTTETPVVHRGSMPGADAAMNDALAAAVREEVRALADVAEPRELIVRSAAELQGGALWSFSLEGMVDFEGAAHPSSSRRGITFDAASGKVLSLADLFLPGTDWARVVNGPLFAAIDRQVASEELMVFEEAHPDVATYADQFFLRPGKLVVFWTDTQFAPHASGQPEFELPCEAFAAFLRPEYVSW